MNRLLLIAFLLSTAGLVLSAANRDDVRAKNIGVLKKSLGLDRIPPAAATQPARGPVLRAWSGLRENVPFLSGWSIMPVRPLAPVMPYGMSRMYVLKKQGGPEKQRPEEMTIWVFIGTSAEAAREMALQRIVTTSMGVEFLARHLSLSREGPGDMAVVSKRRDETEGPVVFFVRDNIAVVFEGSARSLRGVADSLDEEITKAAKVYTADYQKLCPAPVVSRTRLDRKTNGSPFMYFIVTLSSVRRPDNCEIRGVLDDGTRGVYVAKEGIVHFKPARESRAREYGVVVYDRASLLSRWTTGKVADSN